MLLPHCLIGPCHISSPLLFVPHALIFCASNAHSFCAHSCVFFIPAALCAPKRLACLWSSLFSTCLFLLLYVSALFYLLSVVPFILYHCHAFSPFLITFPSLSCSSFSIFSCSWILHLHCLFMLLSCVCLFLPCWSSWFHKISMTVAISTLPLSNFLPCRHPHHCD